MLQQEEYNMSIIEEYTEAAVIERTETDTEDNQRRVARISFGTFVLRVPTSGDN